MSGLSYVVACPGCRQKNRIRDGLEPGKARCGRCGGALAPAMLEAELKIAAELMRLDARGVNTEAEVQAAIDRLLGEEGN